MTITTDEKKVIRAQLRDLRGELKTWTLKTPGLHIDQALVCQDHRKPNTACEPCCSGLYRKEKTDRIRSEIRTLNDQLTPPEPERSAVREATVITGNGEQLVMFV
ncbi:hypothetical protein GFH48_12785 [Streptomyces fagopyri]|uniref:Uncharacterized protein n=1 Tax=Streptomyces fagopyri TaxID=2662397 RepID=A0A5Q0LAF1_9ACTN|nr:hypothetical protein [Streptomyces fagopyri]QFZ74005.1 hypothetical protein GFH48_12785 [Streptomyces fagopyri]